MAIRTFRNSDPPRLARLWNAQSAPASRAPEISARLLDETVLAKLYFDPRGLFVAERDGHVAGFAHAGFGPNAEGSALDKTRGCLSALVIEPRPDEREMAAELVAAALDYLRTQGAETAVAGGPGPVDPFYLGLYGGSASDGLPADDERATNWLVEAGFQESARRAVLQLKLATYRPPVERAMTGWQRSSLVERSLDLASRSWFDAATLGQQERWIFRLTQRPPASRKGRVEWWGIQPLADRKNERMAGWLGSTLDSAAWTDGLAKFLIADSLRRLKESGCVIAEAQVGDDEPAVRAIFDSLGFKVVTEKRVLMRRL